MTRQDADRYIRSGAHINIVSKDGETTTIKLVRRDKSIVYTANGDAFHRDDIRFVSHKGY